MKTHPPELPAQHKSQNPMRPRYADLFVRLRNPDPIQSDAAFDAILFDRGEALPELIECYRLASKDHILRFYAIQLMGFSGHAGAMPILLEALTDREPMVRAEACRSLEDLGSKEAIPALEARVEDMDAGVRIAAIEALEAIRK
jgi:HEAT repeat protein